MLRALKIAIVVMGVLIVGATVTLVALVVQRLGGGEAPLVEAGLGQPPGSRILGIAGGGERVVVHVTGGGLPDRILLLDPARGRVVGTLTAEGGAPGP